MNHARTNPGAYTALGLVEDGMHHPGGLGRCLNTVQALTSVAKSVRNFVRQQVLLGERPQMKHI